MSVPRDPRPLDEVVAVHKRPSGGVELHAIADGEGFVLTLDDAAGLALADDLTVACERPREVAA